MSSTDASQHALAAQGDVEVSRRLLLRNHLCALESQRRCLAMLRADEAVRGARAHAVLFVRPDALLQAAFPSAQLQKLGEAEVLLPHAHGWGGYNDRLAALCRRHAALYAERSAGIKSYLARQPAGSVRQPSQKGERDTAEPA